MKFLPFILCSITLFLLHANQLSAQKNKYKILKGSYEIHQFKDQQPSYQHNEYSTKIIIRPHTIRPTCCHTLELLSNRRMKIVDNNPITTLGLNLDNPTVHGRYYQEGDSLVIQTLYTIQHFNRHAKKRRVKRKHKTIKKYYIRPDGMLQISEHYAWRKQATKTPNN